MGEGEKGVKGKNEKGESEEKNREGIKRGEGEE